MIAGFAEQLREPEEDMANADRIDRLTALENAKSAIAAAQAVLTAQFEAAVRAERREAGVPREKWSAGVSAQVALARKDSPHRGQMHTGHARTLFEDMPCALELLRSGVLNEWRSGLIVKEIVCLDREDRRYVDRALCSDPATLSGLSNKAVTAKAHALAAERDPAALVARARKAPGDRHVSTRPAPDVMAYLTALLPVKEAVCVQAKLGRDADAIVGSGDPGGRSRAQIMADLLVQRVTGVASPAQVPVAVNVVISDEALSNAGDDGAVMEGHGPIPAALAREMIANAVDAEAVVTLRKLFARPATGALTAMESAARLFPAGLRRFVDTRDRWCRMPWCGAPIRHHDHVVAHSRGGPTSAHNGAGLCAACNQAKEAPGWSARTVSAPGDLHTVETRTPTGHTYRSTAPAMPGTMRPQDDALRRAS